VEREVSGSQNKDAESRNVGCLGRESTFRNITFHQSVIRDNFQEIENL
jgi:hypothetical protein